MQVDSQERAQRFLCGKAFTAGVINETGDPKKYRAFKNLEPQMNADEHRSEILILIRVYPRSSAARIHLRTELMRKTSFARSNSAIVITRSLIFPSVSN